MAAGPWVNNNSRLGNNAKSKAVYQFKKKSPSTTTEEQALQ